MATPDKPAPEPVEKKAKASAAKKAGKKEKKAAKPKLHGRAPGDKTAREYAVDYLKAHHGRAKFGDLTKWVADKLGGNLSWTPTYYLKSPGFSRPERGVVAFSEKEYKAGQARISEERRERLAEARKKAGKGKKAPKGKKGKKESTLERRQRTAKELKEKNDIAKAEFDEAAAQSSK